MYNQWWYWQLLILIFVTLTDTIVSTEKPKIQRHQALLAIQNWLRHAKDGMKTEAAAAAEAKKSQDEEKKGKEKEEDDDSNSAEEKKRPSSVSFSSDDEGY